MTQKTIKTVMDEIYSKSPKMNYATNKTNVFHIQDSRSLDILELKDYGPEKIRSYRYVLLIFDNFSNFA